MSRWLGNFLASSIGRKVVVALTGLLLVGFLAEHLYGNLKLTPLLGTADGSAFEHYREGLHDWGVLLKLGEVGLLLLFVCHAFLALRLTLENRQARRQAYRIRSDRGGRTIGSASMFITGSLLLAYLIKHVTDFRFDGEYQEAPSATVAATLSEPLNAAIYVLAMGILALHLSHGFQSAVQTIGLNHPRWTPCARALGWAIALGFGAGFAAIPVYFMLRGN